MPYAASAVLVGFLASVLWPYVPILLGLGAIFAIIGWMIEHPIIGITIVVSIYWLDSVYVGWSTMSGDASLEQGGRWCVTIRAATIAVVLSLLAFIPTVWALVGSVAMVAMIICLERNGTIVNTIHRQRNGGGTGVSLRFPPAKSISTCRAESPTDYRTRGRGAERSPMAAPWVQGPPAERDRAAYPRLHVWGHNQVLIIVLEPVLLACNSARPPWSRSGSDRTHYWPVQRTTYRAIHDKRRWRFSVACAEAEAIGGSSPCCTRMLRWRSWR